MVGVDSVQRCRIFYVYIVSSAAWPLELGREGARALAMAPDGDEMALARVP